MMKRFGQWITGWITPPKVLPADAVQKAAAVNAEEAARRTAVRSSCLLDTRIEERFERLARLAAVALNAPVATISLIDGDRVWFKSALGLNGLRETQRRGFFCDVVVRAERAAPFVVENAARDSRFAGHPLVAPRDGIRFYAGLPIHLGEVRVGTLAVMDRQARTLPAEGGRALADLVGMVEQELKGITLRETMDRLAAAERRAEEQHARFAAFMDHLPNVAFMKDATGRLIYLNRQHREVFGIHPPDVLGKRDDEWLPSEVAAQTMDFDRKVVESGQSSVNAELIPTARGVRHWLTFKFPVPTVGDGRLLGGVAVDITEQKEVEKQLQDLSSLQRAILDSADFSIVAVDREGTICTFNAASERLLGYRAQDVIGREKPDLWMDPAELASLAATLSREAGEPVAADGSVFSHPLLLGRATSVEKELTMIRQDGTRFPASLSITAMRTPEGEVTGYVGIAQDITARRQAESALNRAKESAELANRAKSTFVANVSHEVRTPLNGVLGVIAMLQETELNAEQRSLAHVVQSSAESLLSIVNDVLDFSKIEAGRIELEKIDFNLVGLLDGIVELNAARASEKCLVVHTETAPEVPNYLHGDPLRLRQVLNNLVGNAIKFSERGQVTVRIRPYDEREDRVRLRFDVNDRGVGIPPEKQAGIFDPFTQADVSTTRQFGGTGLGLSVCRQLVELMGGQIGVKSEVEAGSTFWFTAEFGRATSEPSAVSPTRETDVLPRLKLRVLLAEDSATNRLVATHQLQKLGCEVTVVENGQQAVEAISVLQFDVVLMDCQMPVMDGYTATAEIRRHHAGAAARVPIIALTANAMSGERERCLALGMDGYLAKPFRTADLLAVLNGTLGAEPVTPAVVGKETASSVDSKTLADLRAECREGEEDYFGEYVNLFTDDAALARREFVASEESGNVENLRRAAHRLRGAAANFGAHPLMQLCGKLEEQVTAEKPSDALALLPALRGELARVEAILRAEIS